MKKGFTLIEVLAVVIVIGILSTIIASVVSNNIYDSRKQAFIASCINLSNKAEEYMNEGVIPEPDKFVVIDFDDIDMRNKNKLDPNSAVVFANHGTTSNPIIKSYVYTSNDYFMSNGVNPEYLYDVIEEKSNRTITLVDDTLLTFRIWQNYKATEHYTTSRFNVTSSLKTFNKQEDL